MKNTKSDFDIDESVRPQDDFFGFVNNRWIAKNPIPEEEAVWGSFYVLRDNNLKKLKAIAEEAGKKERGGEGAIKSKKPSMMHERQLVRDFYASALDEKNREKKGLAIVAKELKNIARLADKKDIPALIANLHMKGIDALWGAGIGQDEKKSDRMVLNLFQGGISLPDRDYYFKKDETSERIRREYRKHIERMFALFGVRGAGNMQKKNEVAEIVMKIETALAKASMTAVERRDIEAQYNKQSWKRLEKEARNIDWREYFRRIGVKEENAKEVIVCQPIFFKTVGELLGNTDAFSRLSFSFSLDDWKTYLQWKVLDDTAGALGGKFERANFDFYGTILSGTKKMRAPWKRAVGAVSGTLGEAIGRLYVEKYFPEGAKKKIDALVDDLVAAYRERIAGLDWMSEQTKKKALAKLAKMGRKLGYPSVWKRYPGLVIRPDEFLENCRRAGLHEWKRDLKKLGKAPDRNEWEMSPQTVNAYCHFNMNEIVFPAGILQPPFFDPNADMAINYGAIGSVIGHEITHGFDDQGRQFDGAGNLREWWTSEDKKKFEAKAQRLAKQYDTYEAAPGLFVNGKLTLGENIADLGGLTIAYHAFQKYLRRENTPKDTIKNFTHFSPEQLFFIGFALAECGIIRLEALRNRIMTDPHSPSLFRVNGVLPNMEEFYEAFGVKKGDKLFRDPKARVKIW